MAEVSRRRLFGLLAGAAAAPLAAKGLSHAGVPLEYDPPGQSMFWMPVTDDFVALTGAAPDTMFVSASFWAALKGQYADTRARQRRELETSLFGEMV